ncbi:MAG: CDP-glucose 4,6-dehydratase [Gammaproteobacteria bacterium]|nr:CDP-glucose 4,6-dehydratase [Gammaproteobacteria bacterium]
MFNEIYKNRRVLVTGHTGFKGSWLVLWLQMQGAKVTAISLPPETTPNHWDLLELDVESSFIDIREEELLRKKITEVRPEIVFHLAAQSLVRRSYRRPIDTWSMNVMGTANLLDACRQVEELKAIVVITTDKCYENKEWVWGYREVDRLGGHDPYSASKAGSELVAASYRKSFFNTPTSPLLATARAGNVIGGGDWSEDRLIPDLVRSVADNKPLEIRSPNATRPWQHVLECLSGYLLLGQELLQGNKSFADAWNFGPDREGNRQVHQVLEALKLDWPSVEVNFSKTPQPHEAQLLHLDSGKAREQLSWRPVWTFDEGVAATAEWYRTWMEQKNVISKKQLQNYIKLAHQRGLSWAEGSQYED